MGHPVLHCLVERRVVFLRFCVGIGAVVQEEDRVGLLRALDGDVQGRLVLGIKDVDGGLARLVHLHPR